MVVTASQRHSLIRARAKAAGTHAVHGYAGIARKGSIDSLVLTELAWDREELGRRMADGEMLYYSRERAPREARRLHHIVIDASASMRGEREVFARGLAIALGKKLLLAGEEVWMRFFDSRLYEVQRATERTLRLVFNNESSLIPVPDRRACGPATT